MRTVWTITCGLILAVLLAASAKPASAQDAPALPDPIMTPGEVATSDLNVVCHQRTRERRSVPTSRCDAVFRAYSIPDTPVARYSYECDHLVPLALGGSNAAVNLWPQPDVEAARKDRLEVEMQRLVCSGELPLPQAQREIADDWTLAYARYVAHTLPPAVEAAPRASLTQRLEAGSAACPGPGRSARTGRDSRLTRRSPRGVRTCSRPEPGGSRKRRRRCRCTFSRSKATIRSRSTRTRRGCRDPGAVLARRGDAAGRSRSSQVRGWSARRRRGHGRRDAGVA